jgi:hypothetical protein
MKKLFTLSTLLFCLGLCSGVFAQDAAIQFKSEEFDFGTIKQGDVVEYSFVFTNTSKEPVSLTSVKPSCGCTVPEWPREALKPGESAKIDVKFNSAGKIGRQLKSVSVFTSADPDRPVVLRLKGEIVAPAVQPGQ